MIYIVTYIVAALILIASALVFIFKDVLHIAVALSTVFLINSVLFLILQQPILAVIQLFIMIGGVSTYLFVGVAAASYSNFKYTNYIALVGLSIVIFSAITYGAYSTSTITQAGTSNSINTFSSNSIASTFNSSYSIISFYIIGIMLFSIAITAILLLNRLRSV